jgi:hypothetical protein
MTANKKIEATGNKRRGFSKAGCPCASFPALSQHKFNKGNKFSGNADSVWGRDVILDT